MLAKLAERVEREGFLDEWLAARDAHELKSVLVHEESSLSIRLREGRASGRLVGRRIGDAGLPGRVLVTLLRRDGQVLDAASDVVLEEGDRLTFLGDPEAISELRSRYRD